MADTTDTSTFTTILAQIQRALSSVLEQWGSLNRQIELLSNEEASTAAEVSSLSSAVNTLGESISANTTSIDAIPTAEYNTTLENIISTQQQIVTQLTNIENAILSIPSSSAMQDMATQLDNIISAIGLPPEGQDIWSRLSTITTVTTGNETAKVRVYGSILNSIECEVNVYVYDCLSNSKVVTTQVMAGDTDFEFYVVPGKYTVEFNGDTIATKSVTIDVPSGATSFDMTT